MNSQVHQQTDNAIIQNVRSISRHLPNVDKLQGMCATWHSTTNVSKRKRAT